jgi:thiosulfate dehydrogenase [quinone] large subunit
MDSPLAGSWISRALVGAVRIGTAVLWINNVSWKTPPRFGEGNPPTGLYFYTRWAFEHPVFPPYAWLVRHVVLPNFTFFGWLTLTVEGCLGAFLLIGLATRFWALVGMGQTLAIGLSVANGPGEWVWSYLLMLFVHALLFATAAGRSAGLDGLLRDGWQHRGGRLSRLLVMAS